MRPLTCDQVFERLTRAPFPATVSADGSLSKSTVRENCTVESSVEAHLQICHECRCLAEALRPAVDLLNETMVEEERRTLPAYQGELATILQTTNGDADPHSDDLHSAVETVVNQVVAASRSRHGSAGLLLGLIPAVGLAVLLLMAAVGSRRPTVSSVESHHVSAAVDCGMAGLECADECLPEVELVAFGNVEKQSASVMLHECGSCHASLEHALQSVCCTNCHTVGAKQGPKIENMTALLSSCSRCHL